MIIDLPCSIGGMGAACQYYSMWYILLHTFSVLGAQIWRRQLCVRVCMCVSLCVHVHICTCVYACLHMYGPMYMFLTVHKCAHVGVDPQMKQSVFVCSLRWLIEARSLS